MKPTILMVLALVAVSLPSAAIEPVSIRHAAAEYEGAVRLGGGLVALLQREAPSMATMLAAWRLDAEHVHVERDEALAPDTGAVAVQSRPTTTTGDYHDAHAEGSPRTGGYSLGIFPLPERHAPLLTVATNCLRTTADAQGTERADRVVGGTNRQPATARVGDSMKLLPCLGTTWTAHLTGDFLMVLYDWTAHVTDAAGTYNWTSGTERTKPVPEAPVDGKRMMQTYLTARNATLTFTTPEPERLATYTTAADGDVNGSIAFIDAHTHDRKGRLDVEGNLTVSSHRVQDLARTDLMGDVQTARLDDQDVLLANALQPGVGAPTWTWGLLLAASLAGSGATWACNRRRVVALVNGSASDGPGSDAHLALAQDLHAEQQHRLALWHLRRATRLDRRNIQAWLLRGRCHHALRHHVRATHSYRTAHRTLHDEGAASSTLGDLAYLVARCHALRGRARNAADWLRTAGRHDLRHLVAALTEPDFARVEGHPVWAVLLGQYDVALRE